MEINIREMIKEDWEQVANIYLEGINTEKATFETCVPSFEEWDREHIKVCRLVAYKETEILGWVALSKVSNRSIFSGVAEVSLYINSRYQGCGVGTRLLEEVVKLSEENGFWSLESVIIEENLSSINLHKKSGFREIGYKEKIAKMRNGKWHNVVIMERRSSKVGKYEN